ncbi:hypothetical protein EMCRGX_G009702 [Ephydatia muelleri]
MYVSAAYPGQPPAYSQQNQGAYPPQPPGYVAEQQPYPAQPYPAQLQGYPQPAGYPATDFKQYPPDYNYPQPGVSQYPPTAQQQASRSVLVVHEQPTISTQAVSYGRTGDYFLTLSVIMTAVCCIFGGWWNLVLTIPAVVLAGSARSDASHGRTTSALLKSRIALGLNVLAVILYIVAIMLAMDQQLLYVDTMEHACAGNRVWADLKPQFQIWLDTDLMSWPWLPAYSRMVMIWSAKVRFD